MEQSRWTGLAAGTVAGMIGTVAMHGFQMGSKAALPGTMVPKTQDPGDYMIEQLESVLPPRTRDRIGESAEHVAMRSLHFGYGTVFGTLYGAVRSGHDHHRPVLEGAALGAGVWALGYLGWLPKTGITPPVREQTVPQALGPIARHVLYGVVVGVAYGALVR